MVKIIFWILGAAAAVTTIAAFTYQLGQDSNVKINVNSKSLCAGISITKPTHNAHVADDLSDANNGRRILTVKGIARNIASDYQLGLIIKDYGNPHNIHPVDIQLNETKSTWTGNIYFDKESDKQVTLAVLLLGPEGNRLHDYYRKVAREVRAWVALESLTSDTLTCDEVTIHIP